MPRWIERLLGTLLNVRRHRHDEVRKALIRLRDTPDERGNTE